jgi:iron complex outermembrane receptor protein
MGLARRLGLSINLSGQGVFMFRRTKICAAVAVVLGGGLSIPALAQQADQPQRIEITGSAIKRVDAEGPAPVEIYTRKDIQRTGATTISELVKNISVLDIDDQGELTANSPSGSGTSNLQIRGLSERNLLILLNGRRLPTNALADGSGAGAAVDVNNIPLSAIERIEVLKDGGSAIYGADAVAGVINFITKKNYNGLEARADYGTSSRHDGQEKGGGLVFGFGDYDASGFNILGAVDVFKRDPIMRKDRELTRSADWRRYDGKTDGRSSFHPNGNILDDTGTVVVGQVVPCPPEDLRGTTCRFDFNKSVLTAVNGADRWSSMLVGNLKLGSMRAFSEVMYSESKDLFEAQPAPGAYFDQQDRLIFGRFMQVGPRTTNRKASLLSLVAGLEGSFGSYDWDVALGQGTSKVSNHDKNYVDATLFDEAISSGLIDPTRTDNPESEINKIRLTPKRDGKSVIRYLNAKISGPIVNLPGGQLAFAVGGSLNKETIRDTPDANQQAGNVFGSIAQAAVDASRQSQAIFGELSIPLLKNLEGQVAVRYDRYSAVEGIVGGTRVSGENSTRTSPKVAVKYKPADFVLMRASYAESFLAPTLKQMFGGQDAGAESTSDTEILCPAFGVPAANCDNFPYDNVTGSNPNLKPEIGKTYNVGFVLEPHPAVSLGVDLWRIRKRDEVGQPSVETAVQLGNYQFINGRWTVFTNNQNLARTESEGADIDVRVRFPSTDFGRVTLHNTSTYYTHIKTEVEPGAGFDEYVGTFLNPRWRNTFTLNLEYGPWNGTMAVRTTAGMLDTDQPHDTTLFNNARRIGTYEELDLGVQYSGFKNLTLGGIVKNALDRMPPFSQRGAQNQYGSLGFPWIYSPRGRFFQVTANYKFY